MFSGADRIFQTSAQKFPAKKWGKVDGTEGTAYQVTRQCTIDVISAVSTSVQTTVHYKPTSV